MPPKENLQPKPPTPPTDELKRIRTYESDVQEIMQKGQVSKATIALAENAKQIKKEDAVKRMPTIPVAPEKIFPVERDVPFGKATINYRLLSLLIGGVVLLAGVGVTLFFFLTRPTLRPLTQPPTTVPKATAIIFQGRENRTGVITRIQKTLQTISVPQNEIKTVPIQLGVAGITTEEFFELLSAMPPDSLVRALSSTPVLGIYGFQGGQPFLLFGVSSFDHAFAGMLAWEKTLLDDMGPLFGFSPRILVEETVGSTTTDTLTRTIAIKDIIIRNKDARAAFDTEGNILFLYAFLDKQTLVLTTGEDTLRALQTKAGGGRLK